MGRSFLRLVVIGCMGGWTLLAGAADLKITTETTWHGHTSSTTRYVKGQRSRIESRPRPEGPPRATIYQCDARRIFHLDPENREYTTYRMIGQGIVDVTGPPPVQSKRSGGKLTITIETIDTGERREMFGHTARHILIKDTRVAGSGACSQSSESEQDGWFIDPDTTGGCFRPVKRHPGVVVESSSNRADEIEIKSVGRNETGDPLELTTRDLATSHDGKPVTWTYTCKVTKFDESPLDPALFEVPSGFKRVLQLRGEAPSPLGTRLYLAGLWLRDDLTDLFR